MWAIGLLREEGAGLADALPCQHADAAKLMPRGERLLELVSWNG